MSYDLKKMKNLVKKIRDLEIILGDEKITISKKEKNSKDWATKSIFLRRNINKGEIIKKKDLSCKRPGIYIPASELIKAINKKAKKKLKEGNPLRSNDF